MHIEIHETTEQDRPILENLYQFYLYDYTDFETWDVEATGRYDLSDVDDCWVNPDRFTYLIWVDGALAGFVLIDLLREKGLIEMTEFFVMRKYRRRGVGAAVARQMFDRFRGRWRVAELDRNVSAQRFWRRVIGEYTGSQFEDRQDRRGPVQFFDNSAK